MNNQLLFQIIIFVIALAFIDPLDFLMPTHMQYIMLGIMTVTLGLYGILVFKEQVADERDVVVRAFAHRVSYFFGMCGIILIMAYHLFTTGHVYPEIVLLLLSLIIIKSLATWYGQRHF
jgi:hypothetical protein